jgi:hypothetical protein
VTFRAFFGVILAALILLLVWYWRDAQPPAALPAEPPSAAVALVAPRVLSAPVNAVLRETAWVVWYGADDRIYRRAASADYQELYFALHQSLSDDRDRLNALAWGYFKTELEPVLAELRPRLKPWLDDALGLGESFSRFGLALQNASEILQQKPVDLAENALVATLKKSLADGLVQKFRLEVLGAGATQRALRAAAERALSLLRHDLLQNCDRYDRAFRWFVLNTPGTVESLEDESAWYPDPSWQPTTATFLSLCEGLRHAPAGVGIVAEDQLTQSFAAFEVKIFELALAHMENTAQSALQVAREQADYVTDLEDFGVTAPWAGPPAWFAAYITSPWRIGRTVWRGLGGSAVRAALTTDLAAAADHFGETLQRHLYQTGLDYLEAELERMTLGLAARSEGGWSIP